LNFLSSIVLGGACSDIFVPSDSATSGRRSATLREGIKFVRSLRCPRGFSYKSLHNIVSEEVLRWAAIQLVRARSDVLSASKALVESDDGNTARLIPPAKYLTSYFNCSNPSVEGCLP